LQSGEDGVPVEDWKNRMEAVEKELDIREKD
jgi:hypothetical protein